MQPDAGFLKFVTATGFDPRRDLHEILAATSGTVGPNGQGALIVGRGSFQPTQITAAATANGGTVTQYRGFNILSSADQGSNGAVVFLDTTTAVMGDPDTVKAAIDRRISGTNFSGPLVQKANEVSATNQAWFATLTPLSDFLSGKPTNPNLSNITNSNLVQAILQASGGVNFGSTGVTVSGDAVTRSNQDAQALVDVMKFLASMVQMKAADNPKVASLADAATFTANGAVMHFSLAVPEQQVEQLFIPPAGAKARAGIREKRTAPAGARQ